MLLVAVQSSNLAAVGYAAGVLLVAFHSGAIYVYFGVPWHVHEGLMRAESHGRYFHQHIKDRYACRRVT